MAGTNWFTGSDGLWQEMDHGRKWISTIKGLPPAMDDKKRIPSREGSQYNLDHKCILMDAQRWMTGH